jgi:hypothetical protein
MQNSNKDNLGQDLKDLVFRCRTLERYSHMQQYHDDLTCHEQQIGIARN